MRARSHYHASLSQQEREEVQGAWTHDRVQIIVATIAFGMGALPPLRRCGQHRAPLPFAQPDEVRRSWCLQ